MREFQDDQHTCTCFQSLVVHCPPHTFKRNDSSRNQVAVRKPSPSTRRQHIPSLTVRVSQAGRKKRLTAAHSLRDRNVKEELASCDI